jgi:hypothetical protein
MGAVLIATAPILFSRGNVDSFSALTRRRRSAMILKIC